MGGCLDEQQSRHPPLSPPPRTHTAARLADNQEERVLLNGANDIIAESVDGQFLHHVCVGCGSCGSCTGKKRKQDLY